MTKQEKIEKLIQMEWEDFQKVNNEGGRASCQDDQETFFIMRRSHFAPWTEELIDCVQADMDRAHEQGRNLVMEKYAWMMASTAHADLNERHAFAQFANLVRAAAVDIPVRVCFEQIPYRAYLHIRIQHFCPKRPNAFQILDVLR